MKAMTIHLLHRSTWIVTANNLPFHVLSPCSVNRTESEIIRAALKPVTSQTFTKPISDIA